MKNLRLLLVDDHVLVRAGLRSLLEKFPGIEVVGEASSGQEGLNMVPLHRPDLVVMDVAMAGMNGLETAARLLKDFPNVRVLILSMYANEEYVVQARRIGVSGYLLKDAIPMELERAIQTVVRGETYLSPQVSQRAIDDYFSRLEGAREPEPELTARQKETLRLIAEGKSTREIGRLLNLSVKTIETHRAHLMKRLNIRDVAGLVKYALRIGLVRTEK